jgi:hypothetical protein
MERPMKFVKLTTEHCFATSGKQKQVYININNINTLQKFIDKKGDTSTDIIMSNGQRVHVKETPDEIIMLITEDYPVNAYL